MLCAPDNIRSASYILDFIDDPPASRERLESLESWRGPPPRKARDLVRLLPQTPRVNRNGAADLEQILAADRQRDQLLQNPAIVADIPLILYRKPGTRLSRSPLKQRHRRHFTGV